MFGARSPTGSASWISLRPDRLREIDRYFGYFKPYATSHDELDHDEAVQEEVRNAARTLLQAVTAKRAGKFVDAGLGLQAPRQK